MYSCPTNLTTREAAASVVTLSVDECGGQGWPGHFSDGSSPPLDFMHAYGQPRAIVTVLWFQ
jgi:hypothetical protein